MSIKRILIFVVVFALANLTHAGTLDNLTQFGDLRDFETPTDFVIKVQPDYPAPHQKVTISLDTISYTGVSDIAWVVNGNIIKSGKDIKQIEVETGNLGEKLDIHAVVKPQDRQMFIANAVILPSRITLLKEAETYTPQFYKGRSRYSTGAFVRLQAIPEISRGDGTIYNPDELIYIWKRNQETMQDVSGLGRASIRIKGPGIFRKDLIILEVKNPKGETVSTIATYIEAQDPKIILYKHRPLLGGAIFSAITYSSILDPALIEIVAEPYFAIISNRNDTNLKYTWFVDDKKLPTNEPISEASFTIDGDKKSFAIKVKLQNAVLRAQSAITKMIINTAGAESAPNKFGL